MNKIFKQAVLLLLCMTMVVIVINSSDLDRQAYQNATVQEVRDLIYSTPDIIIVDVREQSEFDAGHIDNAILMPWNSGIFQATYTDLPNISQIKIIYCRSGNRSGQASQFMVDNGYNGIYIYNMLGGWSEWVTIPTPTPTAIATATPTATIPPTPEYVNIAIGKTAKASTTYAAAYAADKAVDGNMATGWGSAIAAVGEQWIYIDLGGPTTVDGAAIKWYNPYFASSYDIYISSDGAKWTPVASGLSGDKTLYGTTIVRYVALLCKVKNSFVYGLAEFEILQLQTGPN